LSNRDVVADDADYNADDDFVCLFDIAESQLVGVGIRVIVIVCGSV